MKRTLILGLSVVLFLCAGAQAQLTLDPSGVGTAGQRINAAADTTVLQVAPNGATQQVIVMVGAKPTMTPSHPVVRQTPAKPVVSKPDTTNVRVLWSPTCPTLPWWAWLLLGLLVLAVLVAALRDRDVNVTNNNNVEYPGCGCYGSDPEPPPVVRTPEGISIVIPPDAYRQGVKLTLEVSEPPEPTAS